jgi:IS30 family transposase
MEHLNCITKEVKYKHLTERDRYKLEGYLEAGLRVSEISKRLNRHKSTVYRELQRGTVERIGYNLETYKTYRANVAQSNYDKRVSYRERSLKIGSDKNLEEYIRKRILKDRLSPDAVIGGINRQGLKFKGMICTKTLYNYVEKGILSGISNANLWEKRKRKKKNHRSIQRVCLRNRGAKSIEERPQEITRRLEYGHWEGDCVKSRFKKKSGLFTLTERKTREQLIFKIKALTQESILKSMDLLEGKYRQHFKDKFKSITLDNGSEFLDWETIEKSRLSEGKRTQVYFAHPYSSWERGTNENQNRMIRRFIPKGTDIAKISAREIKRIEKWMNNCPRKILGYRTANEMVLEATENRFGAFGLQRVAI